MIKSQNKFWLWGFSRKIPNFSTASLGLNMRIPYLTEILFLCSLILFVIFLFVFNSKYFYGEILCAFSLELNSKEVCEIPTENIGNVRVIANYGYPSNLRLRVRPRLGIGLVDASGQYKYKKMYPKGGYRSRSDFGVFDVFGKGRVVVKYVGGENYEYISYLGVDVYKNSSKTSTAIFCISFLLFLFLSIYTRARVFKNSFYKGLPYVFFGLVALTSIAWVALA